MQTQQGGRLLPQLLEPVMVAVGRSARGDVAGGATATGRGDVVVVVDVGGELVVVVVGIVVLEVVVVVSGVASA
jgi:hypothetical protein